MGFIGYLISLVVVGLVLGALGRLVIPGPNPMGIWTTMAVGLGGAVIGGLIGGLLGLGFFTLVLEVAVSAGLVYLVSGRRTAISAGGHRWR